MPKRPNYQRTLNAPSTVPPYASSKWWRRIRWIDIFWVFCIVIMLLWPWIFFGVVWARNGIAMNSGLASYVTNHPQRTNFFLTFVGTMVRLIIGFLFSTAILRFSQEWMVDQDHHLNLFHLSMISGFKNQKVPWNLQDLWDLRRSRRWLRVALVAICWGTFTLVPSGTTSILQPVPLNKGAYLRGSEVDFSSNATDCIDWLNNNTILYSNPCGWEYFGEMNYTTCLGENQLDDILESGRGNILSLIYGNNAESLFSQIDASLQFLGPIRGVLPIGPNGVPALQIFVETELPYLPDNTSYNYTLHNHGIISNVSCAYSPQSPVTVSDAIPGDIATTPLITYSGTCNQSGQVDIPSQLDNQEFTTWNSNNTLTSWSCKSNDTVSPSYFIYLRGRGFYETEIGNITCTISQIQPATYRVKYQWDQGYFTSKHPVLLNTTLLFANLMDQSVLALGGLINEGQSSQANLVAESVITFGVKYFSLPTVPDPEYLRLYEAMIQGIIEYLVTYSRLLYNLNALADTGSPDSCFRIVDGTFTYQETGWSVKLEHIGFLMPLTIVNLASLVIMILAILRTRNSSCKIDPVDARSLILAEPHLEEGDTTGWKDYVTYRERSSLFKLKPQLKNGEETELQPLMSMGVVPQNSVVLEH